MRAQLKQRWIEALKSGRYHQGKGHLRTEQYGKVFHCAMGVLYDLIATADQWERLRLARGSPFFAAYLPIEAYEETGVDRRVEQAIASLNDEGATFDHIADVIERDIKAEPDIAQYVTNELSRIALLPSKLPQPPAYFGMWGALASAKTKLAAHGVFA